MTDEDAELALAERDWWSECDDALAVRERWESLPTNPDPTEDLGYRAIDLDVISSNVDQDTVMVMPHDEDLIREESFLVVDSGAVRDLVEMV
ncbi:MAG: hypothetical protein ABEJ61_01405 [Haloferacaceae archaeon]